LPDLSGFFANLHQQAEVYVCGPIGLLDAGKRFWKLAKRDPVNFVFETFWASGHVPTEGFTVHIPRLGTNVEVPPDFSMLDALENAGVGVISDCRRGECGLCVLDILNVDGVVYHGDMFFSEEQHAQNRRICACVSRVRGAITVDRLINRTTLTAAEIGDQIVSILELRLAAMRAELQKLGVEYQGGSR
jgi:vanillate O-demethylase ferredoxin subunit